MINIDDLTIKEAKQIASFFKANESQDTGLNNMLGKKVIIRTYSDGIWFGKLSEKSHKECNIRLP